MNTSTEQSLSPPSDSRADGREVSVEIRHAVTPDVVAGLELFGRLTGNLTPDDTFAKRDGWRRWYDNNPFGEPGFAVAKDAGQVVGFFSMIPVDMRIAGRKARGGKAEFFVVNEDYRKAVVAGSSVTVPLALIQRLNESMFAREMEATFAVAHKAAGLFYLLSGAQRHRFKIVSLSLACHRNYWKHHKNPMVGRLRKRQVERTSRRRRQRVVETIHAGQTPCQVRQIDQLQGMPAAESAEYLFIDSNDGMLNFRFPSEHYLKYDISRNGRTIAESVFTKPRPNADVRMSYFSPLDTDIADLAVLVAEVAERCLAARAKRLVVNLPLAYLPDIAPLTEMGFVHKVLDDCVFHYARPGVTTRNAPWQINNAQIGFYQYG